MDNHELFDMMPTLVHIAKAINKGVGEDLIEYLQSTNKATNNSVPWIRIDSINTNLRDSVVAEDDTLELHCFKRNGWTGCLLIDRAHKRSFSICTKNTLKRIISTAANRKVPHYLQTILNIQNVGVDGPIKQRYLFDGIFENPFSEEVYHSDYINIMGDEILFGDGYIHWIIEYETSRCVLTSLSIKKLDEHFLTATEIDLMHLLMPNFGELTISEPHAVNKKDAHSLISVKKELTERTGIKDKQKIIVNPKNSVEEKHL